VRDLELYRLNQYRYPARFQGENVLVTRQSPLLEATREVYLKYEFALFSYRILSALREEDA
jgi:hypothetical protein